MTNRDTTAAKHTLDLPILPGDEVYYSDFQFHLPDATLHCVMVYKHGLYAELTQDGERYTVKYDKLRPRPQAIESTAQAQAVEGLGLGEDNHER